MQPTITPAAKRQFAGEVGGLRGLLLGSGGGATAARALGISALAGGVFAFVTATKAAVTAAADLETNLNVFQQVAGASADQMERVAAEARALGQDVRLPGVAAGDAAQAMTELAKAGLSVDDVLAGTRGTLQLATAAMLDNVQAAQLEAQALNSFQLPGSEAVRVADLLAGAANAAQGEIADFGLALSQAAPVAHQAGVSLGETVTFLTEFAKAGIQGSDAGTSLRVALLRLIAPTEEAKAILGELGVNLRGFQTGQIRAPEFFEDLRRALAPLPQDLRNTALATIFGQDAIRVTNIAVREGAAGFRTLADEVTRAGQAQEAADARTRGLSGSLGGFSSNLETLGTTLGGFISGPLKSLTDGLSVVVSDLNDAAVGVDKFAKKVRDADLGPLETSLLDIVPADVSGIDVVTGAIDKIRGTSKDAAEEVDGLADSLGRILPPGLSPVESLTRPERTGEDVKAAAIAGGKIGNAFVDGVVKGIDQADQDAINAAKRVVTDAQRSLREIVAEGQQAVADTIRQGAVAVEAAAVDAKVNLTEIGRTLASQVLAIVETGPLARQIDALQARLDRSREGLQRTDLRRALRDAREELGRAQAQVAGPISPDQEAGIDRFLRPFQEKVKDAQAALEEFNTQGNLDKLRERLDRQKARIQKTLDDVIARFNAGLLSAPAANARVAALLQANVGPMSKAGAAQGFAFRQAFKAEVDALQQQIAEILGGPQTRKTGAEARVVSPASVAQQAAADVLEAREQATRRQVDATRTVKDAVINLNKAQQEALTGPDGTNEILRDIRAALAGRTPSKPSAPPGGKNDTPQKAKPGGRR